MILSGVLLGIWAVKDTIALRNILLVCGALLSSYYIFQEIKYGHLKEQCTTWKVLPIIMLGLIFIWIVIHYLFFSVNPVQQLEELKSTWFRAFLASIIGLGTGLAIRSYPRRLNLLWLGIFVVFLNSLRLPVFISKNSAVASILSKIFIKLTCASLTCKV